MAACTFFGHRDCPETIKAKLREVLVDLITNHGVDAYAGLVVQAFRRPWCNDSGPVVHSFR